jgi:hypothetical protein
MSGPADSRHPEKTAVFSGLRKPISQMNETRQIANFRSINVTTAYDEERAVAS